jgi:hypothetical protein
MIPIPSLVSIPSVPCPACDAPATALVSVSLGKPEPGDLVVCLRCGEVHIVTDAWTFRIFTAADLDAYDLDDLARVVGIVDELRAAYERRH